MFEQPTREKVEQAPRSLVEALEPYLVDVKVEHYSNGAPIIKIVFANPNEQVRFEQLLDEFGVVPWVNGGEVSIDSDYDLRKLALAELITLDDADARNLGDTGTDVEDFARVFPLVKKSIPEIYRCVPRDQENLDEMETRLEQEEKQVDFYFGEHNWLYKQGRRYRWQGRKLYDVKAEREILAEEQAQLLEKAQGGDRAARDQFLRMNIGLVYFVVTNFNYRFPWADTSELIQECFIQMNRCLDKYSSSGKAQFGTYAVTSMEWICLKVMNADRNGDINMPINLHQGERLGKQRDSYGQLDIAELIDAEDPRLVSEDADEDPYRTVLQQQREQIITEVLANQSKFIGGLNAQQRIILKLRMGIALAPEEPGELYRWHQDLKATPEGEEEFNHALKEVLEESKSDDQLEGLSLRAIGDLVGLTHERIRQIEAKTLRLLRHPSRRPQLAAATDDTKIPEQWLKR